MSNKSNAAVECFMNGFNCAQAVFSSYSEPLGIKATDALRIACGFGAGMGRRQETCGAVTGAYLAIGCKYGKVKKEDAVSTEKTYGLVEKFANQFIAKHGSVSCKELLSCDLKSPEGQAYFKENNLKAVKCARYVRDAAEIVETILEEPAANI
jgi:C_GCAxxG_C_C family probable redox protein